MRIIERLKELEAKATPIEVLNADYANPNGKLYYEMRNILPKLLAFVDAFDAYEKIDASEDLEMLAAYAAIKNARKALEESNVPD